MVHRGLPQLEAQEGLITATFPKVRFEEIGDPEQGEEKIPSQTTFVETVGRALVGVQHGEPSQVVELLLEEDDPTLSEETRQPGMQLGSI